MEYLVFAGALAVFVLVIFLLEGRRTRQEEKRFVQYLHQDYHKLSEKEYKVERFVRIPSFFERHPREGQLDDITWNDLGMDDLFKRMNYTLSAAGEEYLYYTLRTIKDDKAELVHFDEVSEYFGQYSDERVKIQLLARELGHTGKYSLYDYLDNLNVLGERSNKKSLFLDFLFLPLIGILFLPMEDGLNFTIGILGIVLLTIYNIISYFKEKAEIDPYITSFAYVLRLLKVSEDIVKISVPPCETEWETLKKSAKTMQAMRRNSYWVMSPFRNNNNGNFLEVFLDYIRMVFHVDLIKFNSMLKVLREHIDDVDSMVCVVGYLETAISVWAFRESLKSGWCKPEFVEENELKMQEGYHPLLSNPVKNSIETDSGVLLTGSNASGKSTFLKTVALNAIMGQTIYTCTASVYRAQLYRIYSSMSLRDDIDSGESYYIVEIKALKRILDAAKENKNILCFVDEVLRGTNTVERIAASGQILRSLASMGVFCFAATHDIELTDMLQDVYDNYHFEEDVRDGDVFFNYCLMPGKATTRNAIKLLELMGYAPEIIKEASRKAEEFTATGIWH